MLSETGWMRVRLVASSDFAIVRLVARVYMTVLFSVTRIGKSAIAALEFASERLLSCEKVKNAIIAFSIIISSGISRLEPIWPKSVNNSK